MDRVAHILPGGQLLAVLWTSGSETEDCRKCDCDGGAHLGFEGSRTWKNEREESDKEVETVKSVKMLKSDWSKDRRPGITDEAAMRRCRNREAGNE